MTLDEFYEDEDVLADEPAGGLEGLLHEIETRWAELASAARGLTEEELAEPSTVGPWSIKDLLAHIAAWEQEGARRIDEIVNGNGATLSWPDRDQENAFNAAAVADSLDRSVDQVVKRLEEAHRDFMDMLASFGDEVILAELEVPAVEWIPGWTYLHYQEHAPQIWAHKNARRRDA
jgi:uncharacterized protein (TIGR03083 family)